MDIKRDIYLKKLIDAKENHMIKVITGLRRSGKSYLLDPIFKDYLLNNGVKLNHIIKLELDREENKKYRDSTELNNYIKSQIKDNDIYYILLDEIQLVEGFEAVLNGLLYERNLDVYVTGSNSKFLSSDIITEFRGRGDEIRVYPLTYSEVLPVYNNDKSMAWKHYVNYGGMPQVVLENTIEKKEQYLKYLFNNVYINDIIERNNLKEDNNIDSVINVLASSVGSLTNPLKLANTFESNGIKGITNKTISSYLGYMLDAFLISKAEKYDIKGKKYISTPSKYYFADIGLRNARLNFRQQEENHLMENIIYNELLYRGYNVDVGIIEQFYIDETGDRKRKQLEIDFVCNKGSKRYYIQSALNIDSKEKNEQESRSLNAVSDNFKKIIVVKDDILLWRNEDGILIIGIQEFLSNPNSLDL